MNDCKYFVKYRAMFDEYGVTEHAYMFDYMQPILRRLGLSE